jgi:hypothetical protein
MADARWEKIKQVLHQAMLLPASERDRFLDEACAGMRPYARKWHRCSRWSMTFLQHF